ncbi:hypothetical protein J6590_071312 [Homalodisca vitripennis]|nr:hypothetical protein J6590_071312 [Homalodisca vitripennis]
MDDLETSIQVLQCEYDDLLSTPRQKNPVSRTVGPRPGPRTHCPPLKKIRHDHDQSYVQKRCLIRQFCNQILVPTMSPHQRILWWDKEAVSSPINYTTYEVPSEDNQHITHSYGPGHHWTFPCTNTALHDFHPEIEPKALTQAGQPSNCNAQTIDRLVALSWQLSLVAQFVTLAV